MNLQFVCFVSLIEEKEYTVIINTENRLLIPNRSSEQITARKVKTIIPLPINELIYVTAADFTDTKEVIISSYLRLVEPIIELPKEPSFTPELTELIKKMILDKTCYPIDMFK